MMDAVLVFLRTYAVEFGSAGGLVAVLLFVWTIVKKPFSKPKPTQLAPDTIDQIKPPQAKDGPALTIPEFIRLRRELKADLEAELAEAAEAEKSQLRARIAELEKQIANPDEALAEAQKRIKDLEALLDREANQIGADRIAEAKAALEQGDYSLADDIFAEIEAQNELAVQETARAAFGRGEVAEAEVRWGDAAKAYQRAARYASCYRTLSKAHEFTHWSGDYATAFVLGEELITAAQKEGDLTNLAMAKNDHAITLEAQGRYAEAEGLCREALEIDRATIGEGYPSYAIRLNNPAGVVEDQGRYAEAEALYREALEIDREGLGEGHPGYAIDLNNLAGVVEDQGRYAEAEGLFREALEIDRATIGEGHPDYAINLNNLAVVVQAQGRYAEAEGLYREAVEIDRATIGEGHPNYAIHLSNLAGVLVKQGKSEAARPLYGQAFEIFRATLPPDHPHIGVVEGHIADLP